MSSGGSLGPAPGELCLICSPFSFLLRKKTAMWGPRGGVFVLQLSIIVMFPLFWYCSFLLNACALVILSLGHGATDPVKGSRWT